MKNLIKLIFIVSLLPIAVAAQNSATIEVPFTMDRNMMIIEASVAGRKSEKFIFDTGTTGLVLNVDVARSYRLKPNGTVKMTTFNGKDGDTVPKFKVSSLALNKLKVKKLEAVGVKSENIFSPGTVGIIGIGPFEGYLLTIDFKNSKLIFRKGELRPSEKTMPIQTTDILEGNVELRGKTVLAHFDSGAPGFIAIPKQWTDDYKLKSEPVLVGRGRTPGGEFEVYAAQLDGEIRIGPILLKDPRVSLLTGGFIALNLGSQFFRAYHLTIDIRNKIMQVEEAK